VLRVFDDAVDDERKRFGEGERTDARDQTEDEGDGETGIVRPRLTQEAACDVAATGIVEAVLQLRNLSVGPAVNLVELVV